MLEMQGIVKRFGSVTALDGVSFRVRPGSVHALVGENGAGKSTLMKILAGVVLPDAGTIILNGSARRFDRPGDSLAAGISMIYQELGLAGDLSVAENIFLGREPSGRLGWAVDFGAMRKRAGALFDRLGFSIDPDARVGDLSAADAQMVEIAKALAREASIIVMDEPTSSLSASEARKLLATVRSLRDRGIAVVYISHRLEEVAQVADDCVAGGRADSVEVAGAGGAGGIAFGR